MKESILNINVSSFKNYNTPKDPRPVNLLYWLSSDKYLNKVLEIRAETDKEKRDLIKATLPAITPSGTFTYRDSRCLIKHSGFIQFDIDFKENIHIANYNQLKGVLSNLVNVAYCGLSVSATGYWGLIPIAYPDKHSQHFDYLYNQFESRGIILDTKPRNVSSLRGYSYDSDAYFNHSAQVLKQYTKPVIKPKKSIFYNSRGNSLQKDIEALISTLNNNGIDITSTYDDWLSIGFAFSNEFGETGRQYFHDVSCINTEYCADKTNRQYDKCLSANRSMNPITIKTFFRKCKDAGV